MPAKPYFSHFLHELKILSKWVFELVAFYFFMNSNVISCMGGAQSSPHYPYLENGNIELIDAKFRWSSKIG